MVILSDKCGQLGNRLFLFANFIANAAEFGYNVYYPYFGEYASFFRGTRHGFFSIYPPRYRDKPQSDLFRGITNSILAILITCYSRLPWQLPGLPVVDIPSGSNQDDFDLREGAYINSATTAPLLFMKGWLFRDERSIRKHAETVRRFFTPSASHLDRVARLITQAREECDILVGIHIRQGDYRKWLGGRHFHTTDEYVNVIGQVGALWPGKRVRYLICSNVQQDEALFAGLDYIRGTGHQLEDLYAFAACDYLIGPPSTYTMWASFYGSVPLFVLESLNKPLTPEGFSICHDSADYQS